MHDAETVAAGPFEVARQAVALFGKAEQQAVGKGGGKGPLRRRAGHRWQHGRIEAAVDQAGRRARSGRGAQKCRGVFAQRDGQRHGMGIDAQHAPVQVAKLRSQPRIAFDHAEPVGRHVVKELEVEEAVPVADGAEKAARHVQRALLHRRRQAAGQFPAQESLGAGHHDGVDHAQRMHHTALHPAVEVVLRHLRRHRLFQQQAVGAAGLRQAGAADPLEGLDQAADDPALAATETGVGLQLGAALDPARQHRKRGLHRLGEAGESQAVGNVLAIGRGQCSKAQIGLGRYLLQHMAGMQLVLRSQDALGRGAGQAQPLGDHRRAQRAKLLVVRQHRAPAQLASPCGLAVGEAVEVEAHQRSVAGKAEQVEAGMVETRHTGAGQAVARQLVPIVGKQPADRWRARPGIHRIAFMPCASEVAVGVAKGLLWRLL